MRLDETDDVLLREHRRELLARRLILHGVRTHMVTGITGLSRSRLATLRRRLMVADKTRPRGPARRAVAVFLPKAKARSEAAALASLFPLFEIPLNRQAPAHPRLTGIDLGERLCEVYEAYCACSPHTEVHLEEVFALRSNLMKGSLIRLGRCRGCQCLILVDRNRSERDCCWHCSVKA